MGRYRKKPVEVEAEQYNGPAFEELEPGDWIVTHENGHRVAYTPRDFAATYEPVPPVHVGNCRRNDEESCFFRDGECVNCGRREPVPVTPGDGAGAERGGKA